MKLFFAAAACLMLLTPLHAADTYPPQAKREFADRVQQLLDDMNEVADRLDTRIKNGSIKDVPQDKLTKLKLGAQELKEKFAVLKVASDDRYDNARKEVQATADKYEKNYYQLAATLQEAREKERKQVAESLEKLRKQLDELKDEINKSGEKASKVVKENYEKARKKLEELEPVADNRWADIRQEIDDLLQKAHESYWEATKKNH